MNHGHVLVTIIPNNKYKHTAYSNWKPDGNSKTLTINGANEVKVR